MLTANARADGDRRSRRKSQTRSLKSRRIFGVEQRHTFDATEPVSPEELRALIERFGERQTARSSQPTVQDVAETLQVEPSTVAAMLQELRESKTQAEIKERLDRLERENAELRARTESSGLFAPSFQDRPRPALIAATLGLSVAMLLGLLLARKGVAGTAIWPLIVLVAIVLIGVVFFKAVLLRKEK